MLKRKREEKKNGIKIELPRRDAVAGCGREGGLDGARWYLQGSPVAAAAA